MNAVYILSAARTPIGKFQGALAPLAAPALGGAAISAAIARVPSLDPTMLGQVLMGNVLSAGIGQAPARQAAHLAGLPRSVGATTVSKVCGSGMRAVMDATNGIIAGEWDAAVAGGMESMSNAPYLVPAARSGARLGHQSLQDSLIHDGLWDPYGDQHMGNCAELCAAKYNFTREDQDAFARTSYGRAQVAATEGLTADERAPVTVPQRRESITVIEDEEPFASPLEKMAKVRPAFQKDGTVTAANASKINDGAAALVLGNEAMAGQHTPIARVVAHATAAIEPEWFTVAPAHAVRACLQRAGLQVSDIGAWEINEAFSVVTLAAIRDLELDPARVNMRGGAVALGHPIGASGARILVTLAHVLKQTGAKYGCAGICIGGGEAAAVILENVSATA